MSKQCRPWSDAAERGVWSGSTLFATHPTILDTSSDSIMNLFKQYDKYGKKVMISQYFSHNKGKSTFGPRGYETFLLLNSAEHEIYFVS